MRPYFIPPGDYRSPTHCRACGRMIFFGPVIGGEKWKHLTAVPFAEQHEVEVPGRWWNVVTGQWMKGPWGERYQLPTVEGLTT